MRDAWQERRTTGALRCNAATAARNEREEKFQHVDGGGVVDTSTLSCRADESWMWMARACRSETSAACGRHGSSQDAVSECSGPLFHPMRVSILQPVCICTSDERCIAVKNDTRDVSSLFHRRPLFGIRAVSTRTSYSHGARWKVKWMEGKQRIGARKS